MSESVWVYLGAEGGGVFSLVLKKCSGKSDGPTPKLRRLDELEKCE